MNLNTLILDFDSQPLKMGDKPLTVAGAIIHSLMTMQERPGVAQDDGAVKLRKYRLACKIQDNPECELPAEDITFIKEQVGIVFSPLVVGRVFEVIDPACLT